MCLYVHVCTYTAGGGNSTFARSFTTVHITQEGEQFLSDLQKKLMLLPTKEMRYRFIFMVEVFSVLFFKYQDLLFFQIFHVQDSEEGTSAPQRHLATAIATGRLVECQPLGRTEGLAVSTGRKGRTGAVHDLQRRDSYLLCGEKITFCVTERLLSALP